MVTESLLQNHSVSSQETLATILMNSQACAEYFADSYKIWGMTTSAKPHSPASVDADRGTGGPGERRQEGIARALLHSETV